MFENITLEMSLKPFKKTDAPFIKTVCETAFSQWKPLLKNAETVSVLLWCADGSELLDYRGSLNDEFEWCYFLGGANQRENHPPEIDPEGKGLHTRNYLYTKNPPQMTYQILKEIICALKTAGKKVLGEDKQILVGETVDPGPEFAVSDFKYNRHNEICLGQDMGKGTMICAHARLKGDNVHYAGFPNGIPDGLPFGTFLGRQAQAFLSDLGFDYLWLSNGLGFGRETWSAHGAIFDGERFDATALPAVKKEVLEFWNLFRAECPDFPVQTRGTNMSCGIDMASDGVPLSAIYKNAKGVLPPPNSPWAALNFDFGLELMGHMSRIAELPANEFMFRYYIHDPWWVNSPWYDRYGGQPHDIYLPGALSRIDENGKIGLPTHFNILSIDNSFGDMPESCVYEPLPHILKARKDAPDGVSPLVWVYPFAEYGEADSAEALSAMYHGDWFVRGAINCGMPLNQVVSGDIFAGLNKQMFCESVVITPVPLAGSRHERTMIDYAKNGGKVIFYGGGENVPEAFCGLFPTGTKERSGVVCRGSAVWVQFGASEREMVCALKHFGMELTFSKENSAKPPVMTIHRHDNAYMFSVYSPNTTVETKLKMSLGAPVLMGYETEVEGGTASYHFPKAEHRECRAFVTQKNGTVGAREVAPASAQFRRRIELSGLNHATVRLFGEQYCADNLTCVLNSQPDFYFVGDPCEGTYVTDGHGTYYELHDVTGTLVFSMPVREERS